MKATYEKKENNFAELRVTVDGDQWKEAQKKAFRKVAQQVHIKGFRPGHAPADLVKKAVNQREVWYEAVDAIAQEALNYGFEQFPEVKIIDRPSLDVEAISDEEAKLVYRLEVYPEVTLGDYKAVEYKEDKVSVKKDEVDRQIKSILQEQAEEILKEEGVVDKGNIAVIDFEGFKDGVAFEGGKGTEYPLEIGSGSFIPGFEDQLIGMTTDEEKDINVTFPEDYGVKELAGQPVVFHVKVDGIKEKKLPELTDEFVTELKLNDDVKTVDDLTKYIKDGLKNQKKNEAEEKATNTLLDGLCDVCQVTVPEAMIEREVEDTFNTYVNRIQQQGMQMDMYYKIMGTDEKGFKVQLRPEAEKKVRIRLILEAIADDLAINPTEQDLEEEYKAMSEQYGMEVEKIKELVPANYLKDDVKMRQALDTLKKGFEKKEEAAE
ncbi:MAG: trigger factor [Erysipelotrichaceae bacterium]|nr:trigger factor [Erysipelotrichaceae bacterium]